MDASRSFERIIEGIVGGFESLAAVDVTSLTDGEVLELVQATQRVRSMTDAACVRSAGALDVSRAWAADGARSPAAWMQWRCRIQKGGATTFLRCARELRDMPATEAALMAGEITTDHVRLLVDAKQLAPEAFAEREDKLVRLATTMRVPHFEKALTYWRHLHEPDGVENEAASTFERREAHASTTFEKMVAVDALLDPIGGAIYLRELERLEQELFDADWAEARNRVGDGACASDLLRSPRQRRADAMRIMAERSAAKPADATEPRILLNVLAGHESVARMCELSNGTVVTPGQVLPVLHLADVERIIFDGPSKVIDVGVRRRFYSGATRTAVQMRDRQCDHPSCDVPAERCEIDHIQPYDQGGLTTHDNGRCKCPFHHRWHHRQTPPAA